MRAPSICPLIATAAVFLSTCWAHMEMESPPPRRSKYNPFTPPDDIDWSMTSPLLANGSNFPCKGYPAGPNVAVVKAGSNLKVQMAGTIFHMGGHCQWSVSYDGGKTFVVLKTVLNDCFTGTGLNIVVPFPKQLPRCEHCVFAWSWINAVGNREFYMNCADIGISSASKAPFTGPAMVVADLPGHPTVPEFHPGSGQKQDDGTELFGEANNVTVRGGAKNPAPITPPPPTTTTPGAPDASVPNPTATTAPASPPDSTPVPAAKGGGAGPCTLGDMRCAGRAAYNQCEPAAGEGSQWSIAMPCAPGTSCSPSGNFITCS